MVSTTKLQLKSVLEQHLNEIPEHLTHQFKDRQTREEAISGHIKRKETTTYFYPSGTIICVLVGSILQSIVYLCDANLYGYKQFRCFSSISLPEEYAWICYIMAGYGYFCQVVNSNTPNNVIPILGYALMFIFFF